MIKHLPLAAIFLSGLLLAGCSDTAAPTAERVDAPQAETTAAVVDPLGAAIDHSRRDGDRARDAFRNPRETLEFFGLAPGMSVAEIWPGYYAEILAPYAKDTGGTYTAVIYPDAMGERVQARNAAFRERFGDADT